MSAFDHILVIGFGGPTKPEEIRPFLEVVTRGRNIPQERLDDVAHHYEVIGGRSPYNEYTFRLIKALEDQLLNEGIHLPVFVGMRNSNPFLKDTLTTIKARGLKKGIALILAPHRSEVSYDRYLQNLEEAKKDADATHLEYFGVEPWHNHSRFIEAQSEQVRTLLSKIPEDRKASLQIIFTNHSIPLTMASQCQYQDEFMESSRLTADALGRVDWTHAYQSRSGNPFTAWLEPDITATIEQAAQKGKQSVLLVPIGFLCDNAEVLYDLDIEAKAEAAKLGLSFYRASTVMDHPAFISMWTDSIRQTMQTTTPRSLKVTTPAATSAPHHPATSAEPLDIREKGAAKNGQPQVTDRRMYFQLFCFTGAFHLEKIVQKLKASSLETVLYRDLNDPYGIGVLLMSEKPEKLVKDGADLFVSEEFKALAPKSDLTMLGRTYSSGREQDLEDWLLNKYRRNALNTDWPWAVWYPLRRKPEFSLLTREEQGKILMEHAMLGMSYGAAGLASDVRLSCYGIDKNDNEFVIGLVGSDLYPLSRLIQDMRKTQQTTKYIQSLGPFFVGHVVWQSPYKDAR